MLTCPRCGHAFPLLSGKLTANCPQCNALVNSLTIHRETTTAAARQDRAAVWLLLLINVAVLITALVLDWSNRSLMLIYWGQSVLIGIGNFFRIMALERFSTEGFKINGKPAEPTDATRRSTAWFFLFHYGFFHAGYLIFIVADSDGVRLFDLPFLLCMAAFLLEYLPEYRQQRKVDKAQVPNIGALMFMPYLRIIPMHITIIFAFGQTDSSWGLLLFGGLKTLADVGMLMVSQAQRRKQLAVDVSG